MQLNLPVLDRLAPCQNILIAGMGGGFDIFCGLPLYFALRERGQSVHLANLTFSSTEMIQGPARQSPTLVGVTAEPLAPIPPAVSDAETQPAIAALARAGFAIYFPEHYLAQWFKEQRGADVKLWW